jgi:hypothetical protein
MTSQFKGLPAAVAKQTKHDLSRVPKKKSHIILRMHTIIFFFSYYISVSRLFRHGCHGLKREMATSLLEILNKAGHLVSMYTPYRTVSIGDPWSRLRGGSRRQS